MIADARTATKQQKYTVEEQYTDNGTRYFAVVNVSTGFNAASTPNSAHAERWARFLNEDTGSPESDPDWIAGSNRNWWARHSSEERVV